MNFIYLVVALSASLACADEPIFSYVDDGGDHGYAKKCDSGSDVLTDYKTHKKKLKQAKKGENFLGYFSESGEGGEIKVFFYSQEKACNQSLGKARQWYDKANQK